MAYRNYSVANGFTVDPTGNGDFTTIAAALTAASSGKDIFIRPGTYTENLTLKAGVNLVGFSGDESTPNVTLIGKLTYTAAGTCTVSNIRLQTNSDFFLVVSGANASVINFKNCYLNCTNNTGISLTNSNAASGVAISNCNGNLTTTGIALYATSGASAVLITYTTIGNTGGSTTANTNSAGPVNIQYSQVQNPCVSSGTGGIGMINSTINTVGTGAAAVQANGSGAHEFIGSNFNSASGTAITIGGGATLFIDKTYIYSDATNAISGTGTLRYGTVNFTGNSSTFQNTLTLSLYNSEPSNATSGFILTSTGTNTSPTWQLATTSGTWTPTVTGQTTAGTTTYTAQTGNYERVGNLVTVTFYVAYTATTGTGNLLISGLPFTIKNTSNYFPQGSIYYTGAVALSGARSAVILQGETNTTGMTIPAYGNALGSSLVQIANLTNAFFGSLTYQV
jgi:hypothetical protein